MLLFFEVVLEIYRENFVNLDVNVVGVIEKKLINIRVIMIILIFW